METVQVKKNQPGEAVVAKAYQAFILKALKANGGVLAEESLDAIIREAYDPIWGKTDTSPWGNISKAKWIQNVASAKSGLDRRGIAIRVQNEGRVYRVLLGNNADWIIAAVHQRDQRQPKSKKQYRKLPQPKARYVVPEI